MRKGAFKSIFALVQNIRGLISADHRLSAGSMILPLVSHPQSPPEAVHRVSVEVTLNGQSGFDLRYIVTGDLGQICLAKPAEPVRQHRLWQHSCFEIFVKPGGGDAYREYNFSPSRAWAAYGFASRREGMHDLDSAIAPAIMSEVIDSDFVLTVSVSDPAIAWASAALIGLSVIIEEVSGRFSYWAIAHPDGPADFHHPDCFALPFPFEDFAP
jgi:hypothetical protein